MALLIGIRGPQARHPAAPLYAPPSTALPAIDDTRVPFAIFAAGFLVFLIVALTASLLWRDWRAWLPGAERETTLVAGVRSAVYTFMSHLT